MYGMNNKDRYMYRSKLINTDTAHETRALHVEIFENAKERKLTRVLGKRTWTNRA